MANPDRKVEQMATQICSFPSNQWRLSACVHLPDGRPQQRIGVVMITEIAKFARQPLCRQLGDAFAASGFYVLRYDKRGTSDSPGNCDLTFDDRVADLCAATRFLRAEYNLDKVLFWGTCMGAAAAVHASARLSGPFRPDGLILWAPLANPDDASLPEFNYRRVTFSAYLRKGLTGSLWNRLQAFVSDRGYRANLLGSVVAMGRSSFRNSGRLERVRSQISRVGPLLAQYEGLSLLIYGDTDPFWIGFTKRINAGDRLGLSKMKSPPKIALAADADHMFHSVQQTSEVIRLSVSWATAFRDGQDVCGEREEIRTIFASPARGEGRDHKEDSPLPLGEGDRAAVGEGIAATAIRYRNPERRY